MALPLEVQQDLMSLIESGLGKVNSNALSTGSFDSGVGTSYHMTPRAPTPHFESRGSVTPMRPARHGGRSIRYRGLESPAGQRWLNSPAFSSRKKMVPKTPLIVSIMNSSKKTRNEVGGRSLVTYSTVRVLDGISCLRLLSFLLPSLG